MINAWRDAWTGIGDFPFLYVQLAPYTGYAHAQGNYPHGDISAIRLAQADSQPKIGLDTTGMAVTIDLGDPKAPAGDVHSRLKETVAERLALQAMHAAYAFQEGEVISNYDHPEQTPTNVSLYFSGPSIQAASSTATTVDGLEVTLSFAHGEGLYTNDTNGCDIHRKSDGNGGECCAAKDTFELCTGSLDDTTALVCVNASSYKLNAQEGTIVVTGPATIGADSAAPTSIRHAYANYPQCALYNKAKLPASPFVTAITTSASAVTASAVTGSVAATPPMGLNSWNGFHCNVDERKMRAMADALVTTGLKDAGYSFVNIDDCWCVELPSNSHQTVHSILLFCLSLNFSSVPHSILLFCPRQVQRSPNGTINADPARFPGGMKALADYIHGIGLKFGVYTAQHSFTCQRRPGSYMHEEIDVESYCDWGYVHWLFNSCLLTSTLPLRIDPYLCPFPPSLSVDYLKVDACRGEGYKAHNTSWIKFRAAIDACTKRRGYPIVLSVESCDDPSPGGCGEWIGDLANLWRTCGDIQATFASVMRNVAENTKMAKFAGPTGGPGGGGHWNDADSECRQIGRHLVGCCCCRTYRSFRLSSLQCFKWVTSAYPSTSSKAISRCGPSWPPPSSSAATYPCSPQRASRSLATYVL
jgi:hypothetical protein